MARILLERGPQNDDELWHVVKAFWGVTIPRHTCGDPNHTAPFEAFANAYFEKDGTIALWHGSRGLSGKSFQISILGITKAFFRGADVNMLGGSLAQSTNIHQHMRAALEYRNAPREMIDTEAQYLIRLNNRARIVPLTASQKTVRGPHPPFLLLDEIDEMDIDILNAALGQPLPQKNWAGEIIRPYTVMVSTWQNSGGTFETKYREFQERGLPIYTWCYKCSANPIDGWLSEETIEAKKREIPAEMWRVEYELGEPSIGNRAFDTDSVDAVFSLPFVPIEKTEKKDFEHYVFEEPKPAGVYIVGADWGKDQDYTVIWTLRMDERPYRLVNYIRINRRPYPLMIKMFNDTIEKYSAEAIHDATGVGNAVNDYVDIRAQKFVMTGEKRAGMLTEYVAAVERKLFAFPRIPSAYVEMKYCVAEGSLVRTLRGSVPIEKIKVGDRVLTRKGYRRVNAVMFNGERMVRRLLTSNGHELLLTEDHSVATGRGWISADQLEPGDVVHVTDTRTAGSLGSTDDQVLSGVGMSIRTVGDDGVLRRYSFTASNVLTLNDRFEVTGVATGTIATEMIESEFSEGHEFVVGDPMCEPSPVPHSHSPVSVDVSAEVPFPTVVIGDAASVHEVLTVDDITLDHVEQCTPASTLCKVWDIEVDEEHEFFANDILVHNCRVGDLYEKGGPNDYHLPDTICAASLAWRAGKKWGEGPGDPLVIPKDGAPHRYEKHFAFTMDDELFSGFEQHGEVTRVSEEPSSQYNFLV